MEDNTYSDGQSKNEAALSNLICIKEISTISRARIHAAATRRCDFWL